MLRLKTEEERTVAALHDVVQDSSHTLADLEDNLAIRRLPQLGEKDPARLQRYLAAQASLTS